MRNRVLLLSLASILMSFCIPACAQQSQSDSTVRLIDLTADMIAKVKPYEPPRILNDYEYLFEIKSISDEIRNDPSDDRILAVPEGITIKELLDQLPGVKTDKDGRLITKSRKDIVTSIEFNGVKVYPENTSLVYPDDYKLLSGVIHVTIIDRKHFRKYMSEKDRDDLPKRRAEITITHYPRKSVNDFFLDKRWYEETK